MCVTSHALVRDSLCDKLMLEQRLLRREGERDAVLWAELSRPREELVHSLRWELLGAEAAVHPSLTFPLLRQNVS